MLILTRKLGEGVSIGDDITVVVVAIERDRVRLGFKAPKDVEIWRTELVERAGGGTEPTRPSDRGE